MFSLVAFVFFYFSSGFFLCSLENRLSQSLHLYILLSSDLLLPLPVYLNIYLHHICPYLHICPPLFIHLRSPLNYYIIYPLCLHTCPHLCICIRSPYAPLSTYIPLPIPHLPYFQQFIPRCWSYQYLPWIRIQIPPLVPPFYVSFLWHFVIGSKRMKYGEIVKWFNKNTGSRQHCKLKSHPSLVWHTRQLSHGYRHCSLLYVLISIFLFSILLYMWTRGRRQSRSRRRHIQRSTLQ